MRTRTLRRKMWLVAGIAFAALASVSSAQAMAVVDGGSSVSYRYNLSPAAYQALVARSEALDARYGATSVVDGRSPDTIDAARAAQAKLLTPVDGRSPDTIDAAVLAHSPIVTVFRSPGFQWGDFGIGMAAALGAVLLLAFSTRTLGNRAGRKRARPVVAA